jgi:predicted double-glycine peptidase
LSSIQEIIVNDEVLSKIVSYESVHFMAGYKQGFDTSCGIAVAASILKFFYNINLDEKSLIDQFFTILSAKKDYTISLLDIKKIIEYYGLNVKGVKITRNQILKYSYYAPIILHFEKPEKHFTIYTGFYGQYIFLLDPSIGIHFISDKDFDNKFSGFALIIYGKDEIKNSSLINRINQQLKDKIKHLYSISNTGIH